MYVRVGTHIHCAHVLVRTQPLVSVFTSHSVRKGLFLLLTATHIRLAGPRFPEFTCLCHPFHCRSAAVTGTHYHPQLVKGSNSQILYSNSWKTTNDQLHVISIIKIYIKHTRTWINFFSRWILKLLICFLGQGCYFSTLFKFFF